MATSLWMPHSRLGFPQLESKFHRCHVRLYGMHHPQSSVRCRKFSSFKVRCRSSSDQQSNNQPGRTGIQLYREIERLLTDTVRQSQDGRGDSPDWQEIDGAWVLRPRDSKPVAVVHFVGGIL